MRCNLKNCRICDMEQSTSIPKILVVKPETDDHAALVAYLLSAVRRRDWHAVSDAANDLRVLEARANSALEHAKLNRNQAGGDLLPSEKP